MKLNLQTVNPKTGKVISVIYDTENPPVLEDLIYEQTIDMLSCLPHLTQAQREKIARERADEAARLKKKGKPPFAGLPIMTRAERRKWKKQRARAI